MRLKVIKKLVDINILYSSNETNLANLRKKQAKNPDKKVDVSGKLLRSYIASSLLLLLLFSNLVFRYPFEEVPSLFSNMVAIFLVIVFSNSLTAFWPPIVLMPLKNQKLCLQKEYLFFCRL